MNKPKQYLDLLHKLYDSLSGEEFEEVRQNFSLLNGVPCGSKNNCEFTIKEGWASGYCKFSRVDCPHGILVF